MSAERAFWDASGLVLLCVQQPSTHAARRLAARFTRIAAWWGSPIEIRSAIVRLRRDEEIGATDCSHACARLEVLRRHWAEVAPTEEIRDLARQVLDMHAVRAADALQLAAALVWCSGRPRGRPFVCFDGRLSQAAAAAGFEVRPAAR